MEFAGSQTDFQKRILIVGFYYFIKKFGSLALPGHGFSSLPIFAKIVYELSSIFCKFTLDYSVVYFFDGAISELRRNSRSPLARFSKQNNTGNRPVQPMQKPQKNIARLPAGRQGFCSFFFSVFLHFIHQANVASFIALGQNS